MRKKETYNVSFRCFYQNTNNDGPVFSTHYQAMPLSDIPRWLEAYRFTHPDCLSISLKGWFTEGKRPFEDFRGGDEPE